MRAAQVIIIQKQKSKLVGSGVQWTPANSPHLSTGNWSHSKRAVGAGEPQLQQLKHPKTRPCRPEAPPPVPGPCGACRAQPRRLGVRGGNRHSGARPARPRVKGLQGPFAAAAKPLSPLPLSEPGTRCRRPPRSPGSGAPCSTRPCGPLPAHPGPTLKTPLRAPSAAPSPGAAPHLPAARSLPSSRSPAAAATPHPSPPDTPKPPAAIFEPGTPPGPVTRGAVTWPRVSSQPPSPPCLCGSRSRVPTQDRGERKHGSAGRRTLLAGS